VSGVGSTEPPNSGDAGFAGIEAADESNVERPEVEAEVVEESPLVAVTRERDEYLDTLQRLKAEFDNYRKRVARDQQELAARAHERLVKELVPILDDLERALAHGPRSEAGEADPSAPDRLRQAYADDDLDEGIRLIHRQFSEALAKEGLTEVSTEGKFDPHTQEALLSQPSDAEEGDVIQVVQKGYRLGDRVLRPARVVISAGANG
jgi:molecular chaperone GrpE